MKKISGLLAIILLLSVSLVTLSGCLSRKLGMTFEEPNLAANAVITSEGKTTYLDFKDEVTLNGLYLEERGDKTVQFDVYAKDGEGAWKHIYRHDRIGKQTICYTGEVATSQLKIETKAKRGKVRLKKIEVYNFEKEQKDFKVSQYLRMDGDEIVQLENDEGFTGYYNVVTDVILFGCISLDAQGEIALTGSFDANLAALKRIVAGKDVRIWATVLFGIYNKKGKMDNQATADFLRDKSDTINASIKSFVEKYDLYGIDYDWEFPQLPNQWKAYNSFIKDTSEYTKVSVAIPPWKYKDAEDIVDCVEHFNVMGYDLFDSRGYHSTMMTGGFYSIANTIEKLGIPAEKILLGVPTYGRTTNKSGDAWPYYGELVDGDHFKEGYDMWSNTIESYEYTTQKGKIKHCEGYLNGYGTIRDKTLLAVKSGIGGMMIFRAKCDASYTFQYSLHKAIEEVVHALL